MSEHQKVTGSAYRQIAIDIAKNIVNGKYMEGQKLYGRSVLASHYKVSPETIRKATHLLKDVGILDTEKGSGIEVKSMNKAKEFMEQFIQIENITTIKNEISEWTKRQAKETSEIINKIKFIVDTTDRLKNLNPLTPYEIKITADSIVIGKTASELKFWHNTGGTIVAIRRADNFIVSPGPYATFNEDDIFYIIGNDQSYAAIKKLLFNIDE